MSEMVTKLKFFYIGLFLFISLLYPTKVFAVDVDCNLANFAHFADPTVTFSPAGVPTPTNVLQPWHLECIYSNFLGTFAILGGMISIVFIIYGGIKYTTSHGDPKALADARNTLTITILGLIMIIVSYFIIDGISNFTQNTDLRQFAIPKP